MSTQLDPTPKGADIEEQKHRRKIEFVKLILLKGNTYAFVIVVLVLFAGTATSIVAAVYCDKETALDVWKSVLPAVTAYLGYVFGSSRQRDKDE